MKTLQQIMVTDEDCRFVEDEDGEAVTGCTEAEIAFALSTGELLAEQCLWMHEQGITWEIHLEQEWPRLGPMIQAER